MMHLLVLATMAFTQNPAPTVRDVEWMTGCWTMSQGTRTVREHWMPPAGGMMMGMSRTVSGAKTVEYEFVIIRQGATGLEFVAKPSGQPEATFTSTSVSAREIVFENPQHDFPTRIVYSRSDNGLLATVSGERNGKLRTIEFRYAAADCAR